jgi:hypothetical protein
MKKLLNRLKCFFRHDWEHHQELLVTGDFSDPRNSTVLAWKQCRRCAKSKLIHILK